MKRTANAHFDHEANKNFFKNGILGVCELIFILLTQRYTGRRLTLERAGGGRWRKEVMNGISLRRCFSNLIKLWGWKHCLSDWHFSPQKQLFHDTCNPFLFSGVEIQKTETKAYKRRTDRSWNCFVQGSTFQILSSFVLSYTQASLKRFPKKEKRS